MLTLPHTLLTFFDSRSGDTSGEYTTVYIQRDVTSLTINSLSQHLANDDVIITPHGQNSLDVSRIHIENNVTYNGSIEFFQNTGCTNLLDSWEVGEANTIVNLTQQSFPNDRLRSLRLRNVKAGTSINLFDSASGSNNDDAVYIYVKQDLTSYDIDTLEMSPDNSSIVMYFIPNNGLNGQVSRVEIYPPQ